MSIKTHSTQSNISVQVQPVEAIYTALNSNTARGPNWNKYSWGSENCRQNC